MNDLFFKPSEENDHLHRILFGVSEKEIGQFFADNPEKMWFRSDYEEAKRVLILLFEQNLEQFNKFVSRIENIKHLDKLTPPRRYELLYFLVSPLIDWKQTHHQVMYLKDGFATILYEKIIKNGPEIRLDYQSLVDQLIAYQLSQDMVDQWANLAASVLKSQVSRHDVSVGIVPGAGSKRRPGRPKLKG